jgi:hypothetical protein
MNVAVVPLMSERLSVAPVAPGITASSPDTRLWYRIWPPPLLKSV